MALTARSPDPEMSHTDRSASHTTDTAGPPSSRDGMASKHRQTAALRGSEPSEPKCSSPTHDAAVRTKRPHTSASGLHQHADKGKRLVVLSPRSPLPALAVHIDVDLSAAIQMLRTAAAAAAQEAAAAAVSGTQGRFEKIRCLHRRLERLWLVPEQQVMQGTGSGYHGFALDDFLFLKDHDLAQERSTTASLSSPSPSASLDSNAPCDRDMAAEDEIPEQFPFWESPVVSGTDLPSSGPPLANELLPLRRHNGTVISPPVQLLAAYAADSYFSGAADGSQRLYAHLWQKASAASKPTSLSMPGCVVGLCVRSLLDLYIQSVRSLQPELLPKDSVVLVAAVNVPMMFQVLEEHRLIVHPLDISTQTLMPTEESLHQSVMRWGPRIKAVLCAHLYGGLSDLQPLVDFCNKHRLLLIEDCAESFVGELYRGHSRADVSFFSFGLIKTCTAAGGGIATVRLNSIQYRAVQRPEVTATARACTRCCGARTADKPVSTFVYLFLTVTFVSVRSRLVAARMQSLQALYPFSSRRTFVKKLCVTLGACGLQNTFVMKSLLRLCYVPGWNPGTFLQSFVRGFPSTGELFKLLRVQPNASLLAVLLKRLESWNLTEFLEQQSRTLGFARRLQQLGFRIPGCGAAFKSFWLFPVLTPDSSSKFAFVSALVENGLYAASDATTLVCFDSTSSTAGFSHPPLGAADMMRRIVYLPINRSFTKEKLSQVEAAMAKALQGLSKESEPCEKN